MADIFFELEEGIDEIFDERPGGSNFLALRKIRWDANRDFKLDMRKWFTNSVGDETPGKGVTFMTESGPSNLAISLIANGYGSTENIIRQVSKRDDIVPALVLAMDHEMIEMVNSIQSGAYGDGTVEEQLEKYCQDNEIPFEREEEYFNPKDIIGV